MVDIIFFLKSNVNDLIVAEARYHTKCSTESFRTLVARNLQGVLEIKSVKMRFPTYLNLLLKLLLI